MGSQTLTVKEFRWDDSVAEEAANEAGEAAVRAGADALLAVAGRRVPIRTGALAESGHIEQEGLEAEVVYGTTYGRILRAHPEWEYSNGRSGRWLDEAVEEAAPEVSRSMEAAARSSWPGG